MARTLTFVSLYSGAGGLDLGFTLAGFRPVFANDVDAHAVETYDRLFKRLSDELPHIPPGHRATLGDIRSLADRPGRGDADVVIGGPPCQGFSVAGRMDPEDPRSRHLWDFLDVVGDVQPRAFVMENVKALALSRRWAGLLAQVRDEADALGYKTELRVLDASHFGVPQARQRMFLIGLRSGLKLQEPVPLTAGCRPTAGDTLRSLPTWGSPGNDTECRGRVVPARVPVLRKSPFAGMLFNGQGRPIDLSQPAPTLPATMGGNRTAIVDQHEIEGRGPNWVVGYHRHLLDGGAPPGSAPPQLRRLTVEEAAALQSFPPGMEWTGPQTAKYRQIGNAVPPLLGLAVAAAVRRTLGRQPHRLTSQSVLGMQLPR